MQEDTYRGKTNKSRTSYSAGGLSPKAVKAQSVGLSMKVCSLHHGHSFIIHLSFHPFSIKELLNYLNDIQ